MDRITKADIFLEAAKRNRDHIQGRNGFELNIENPEFGRKVTQVSWHPQQDLCPTAFFLKSSRTRVSARKSSRPRNRLEHYDYKGIHSLRSTFNN